MSEYQQPAARGFGAFAPAPGRGGRPVRGWVAKAWLAALADALLDRKLLSQGRRLAYAGLLGPITLTPGRAAASAHDGDPEVSHQARLLVEPLTGAERGRLLAQVAQRSGQVAALLAGELPRELVAGAEAAGVPVLPGAGELVADCTCPEGGLACVHAVALAYQVSWLLEAEPLLLLLLRGCDQRELHEWLTGGEAAGTGSPPADPVPAGGAVPALAAYRQAHRLPPLPPPRQLPAPGEPPPVPAVPGVDPAVLGRLVAQAADRARALYETAVAAGEAGEAGDGEAGDGGDGGDALTPEVPSGTGGPLPS